MNHSPRLTRLAFAFAFVVTSATPAMATTPGSMALGLFGGYDYNRTDNELGNSNG
jgi:hypothetical protein